MNVQTELKNLEKRIEKIEARNKRVEADKAWEISATRKVTIAILTYVVVTTYFFFIGVAFPFTNAIVPTVGFVLSTLSIPLVKKIWQNYRT